MVYWLFREVVIGSYHYSGTVAVYPVDVQVSRIQTSDKSTHNRSDSLSDAYGVEPLVLRERRLARISSHSETKSEVVYLLG